MEYAIIWPTCKLLTCTCACVNVSAHYYKCACYGIGLEVIRPKEIKIPFRYHLRKNSYDDVKPLRKCEVDSPQTHNYIILYKKSKNNFLGWFGD